MKLTAVYSGTIITSHAVALKVRPKKYRARVLAEPVRKPFGLHRNKSCAIKNTRPSRSPRKAALLTELLPPL